MKSVSLSNFCYIMILQTCTGQTTSFCGEQTQACLSSSDQCSSLSYSFSKWFASRSIKKT